MISSLIHLAEKGILPDFLIRVGIKKLSKVRLDLAKNSSPDIIEKRHQNWVDKMKESPIALVPEKANEQHYEVPPEFFEIVLGSNFTASSSIPFCDRLISCSLPIFEIFINSKSNEEAASLAFGCL